MSDDATKAEAYAQYYLARFRADVKAKEEALATARLHLEVAEREYAAGQMVTGQTTFSVVLARVIEEVRVANPGQLRGSGYNRTHNRHNR